MTMTASALRLDAWEEYAFGTRGEHFAWWSREHLVLGESQWAGRPLVLEESWQAPIMYEALALDEAEHPYWRTVVIVLPRKGAKTNTLAAYADYKLDMGEGQPEILMAAGSDKQAGRLYDAAGGFIRRSPGLRSRMVIRTHVGEIARSDGGGKIQRLSSEGDTQHGANPSLVVIDELHVWRTPKLRRSWGALTTADGARDDAQVFAITTEGEASGRSESILGQLVDENELLGDVERLVGLTISRDHDSRTLVYRYHAVDAKSADPRPLRRAHAELKKAPGDAGLAVAAVAAESRLLDSVMPANPASWITSEYILRQALSSKVMPTDFMQLHANVAADSQQRWIEADVWASLKDTEPVPDGAQVAVAVDAGLSHDSTAVVWAYKRPEDGRVALRCHTWCARPPEVAPAHEFVPGGRIRNGPVKDLIRMLAQRFQVVEVAYDRRYFEDAAMELSDEGMNMVELAQQGRDMLDAVQQFHDAVAEETVCHDGDAVLAAHVAATVAERVGDSWKIRKLKQSQVIDALVASVMAHYRARRFETWDGPLVEVWG